MSKMLIFTKVSGDQKIAIRIDDIERVEDSVVEIEGALVYCTKLITDVDRDYWVKVKESIETVVYAVNNWETK